MWLHRNKNDILIYVFNQNKIFNFNQKSNYHKQIVLMAPWGML